MPQLICVLDRHMGILRANRTVEQWQLGEVLSVKGQDTHAFLHAGCVDPSCYLINFLSRAWEQLVEGQSSQEEIEDLILNRYLQLQITPISPSNSNVDSADRTSFCCTGDE